MIGGCSWPSISKPISSLVVKSIGPTIRSRPRSRSQVCGGVQQRARRLGIVLALEPPEQPPLVALKLVEVLIDVRADAPNRLPGAIGEEILRPARAS